MFRADGLRVACKLDIESLNSLPSRRGGGMADTEDLSCLEKLSASGGNTGVDGVKFGETLTAFAEWQRRAKADRKISDLQFEI